MSLHKVRKTENHESFKLIIRNILEWPRAINFLTPSYPRRRLTHNPAHFKNIGNYSMSDILHSK